jgi:hypothetical protein
MAVFLLCCISASRSTSLFCIYICIVFTTKFYTVPTPLWAQQNLPVSFKFHVQRKGIWCSRQFVLSLYPSNNAMMKESMELCIDCNAVLQHATQIFCNTFSYSLPWCYTLFYNQLHYHNFLKIQTHRQHEKAKNYYKYVSKNWYLQPVFETLMTTVMLATFEWYFAPRPRRLLKFTLHLCQYFFLSLTDGSFKHFCCL